jgi:hypothetical protein
MSESDAGDDGDDPVAAAVDVLPEDAADVVAALRDVSTGDPDDDRHAVLATLRFAIADAFTRATDPETDPDVRGEMYQRLGYLAQTYQSVRPNNWHRRAKSGRDELDDLLGGYP